MMLTSPNGPFADGEMEGQEKVSGDELSSKVQSKLTRLQSNESPIVNASTEISFGIAVGTNMVELLTRITVVEVDNPKSV